MTSMTAPGRALTAPRGGRARWVNCCWLVPIAFGAAIVAVLAPWSRITGTRNGQQVFTATTHSWQVGWTNTLAVASLGIAAIAAIQVLRPGPGSASWPRLREDPLIVNGAYLMWFATIAFVNPFSGAHEVPSGAVPTEFGGSRHGAERRGITLTHHGVLGYWTFVTAVGVVAAVGLVLLIVGLLDRNDRPAAAGAARAGWYPPAPPIGYPPVQPGGWPQPPSGRWRPPPPAPGHPGG